MELMINVILILIGFGGGIAIAGGVVAFIAVLKIIPRLCEYFKTTKYLWLYENTIGLACVFSTTSLFIDYNLHFTKWIVGIIGLIMGVFIGTIAVCVADVLNVMPIMNRRMKLHKYISWLVVTIALGKATGSLIYWIIPGFYPN